MDREGVLRMEPQGIINRRHWDDPRCVEDANGWVQPFSVVHGWEEFNIAQWALRHVLIWHRAVLPSLPSPRPLIRDDGTLDYDQLSRGSTLARIESDLRSFHFAIERTRNCDRPRLP